MKQEIRHKTERRTSAEKQLAEQLLEQAGKSKPDPAKFARAARMTKAAQKSPRFEYNRGFSAIDQLPIYYFHRPGESVTGILGPPGQEMWRGSTYPLVLDDERVIRLPGNRQLHKLIQAADCVGQRVTVKYLGKLYYRYGGHYQKAYELTPAPLTPDRDAQAAQASLASRRQAERPLEAKSRSGSTHEQTKDIRREFAQKLMDQGRTPSLRVLEEFAGEAWAKKAIRQARKEGK